MVPTFTAVTEIDVPVPCTYDLEVASARYLHGLDDGTIPLLLLFSGTVFVATGDGFSVELVPWSAEATYRMPVSVWQELVDVALPRQRLAALQPGDAGRAVRFKAERALPTWDATLAALLADRPRRTRRRAGRKSPADPAAREPGETPEAGP